MCWTSIRITVITRTKVYHPCVCLLTAAFLVPLQGVVSNDASIPPSVEPHHLHITRIVRHFSLGQCLVYLCCESSVVMLIAVGLCIDVELCVVRLGLGSGLGSSE
jgi:hypothetical protein